LQIDRLRAKLEKNLGSINDMTRLPGALFVVDIRREHIAIREAQKLNIPIFAMVDTNCDPREVDYAIPSNDDASKSIDIILNYVSLAVKEGLSERKKEKEVAEVKKEKEEGSKKSDESSNDKVEAKTEVKEKKKRTRVSKKIEE
jgi:small subunit ribosomal protein S2